MVQLFEIFAERYIKKLIELRKIYLVTQSINAINRSEIKKINILVTDYEDKGLATIHKAAVKTDPYASIIDLENEKHLNKFKEMLSGESTWQVYWAIVKDREKFKTRLSLKYKDNIRRYILKNTNWRIGADEVIKPQVQLIFGELFMIIKRGGQELRIKFVEIEKS